MKKTRKQPYYFITDWGGYQMTVDNRSEKDKERYRIGNYFNADEIREQLKIVEQKGFIGWFKNLTAWRKK